VDPEASVIMCTIEKTNQVINRLVEIERKREGQEEEITY